MARTLDKYIMKETVVPFFAGFGISVLMLVGNLLYYQLPNLIRHNASVGVAFRLIVVNIPNFAYLSIPVGMLIATALVVNRLARENEITMMRMGRASVARIFLPLMLVGLLAGGATFLLGETLVPIGNEKTARIYAQVYYGQPLPQLASDLFFKLKDHWIYIGLVGERDGARYATPIVIYSPAGEGSKNGELIVAESGTSKNGRTWRLADARLYYLDPSGSIVSARGIDPRSSKCVLDLEQDVEEFRRYIAAVNSPLTTKSGFEMSMRELAQKRREFAGSEIGTRIYDVEYYSRTAVPFACLIFALVAAPLCLLFARSGNFVGVLISVFVLFFYYVMWTMGQKIGQIGFMPPFLAAWSQNILFGILGAILIKRIE